MGKCNSQGGCKQTGAMGRWRACAVRLEASHPGSFVRILGLDILRRRDTIDLRMVAVRYRYLASNVAFYVGVSVGGSSEDRVQSNGKNIFWLRLSDFLFVYGEKRLAEGWVVL